MKKDLIVVKIGSNTVVDERGDIRSEVIKDIVATLGKIIQDGGRVILVTSGAVRLGRASLDTEVSASVAASVGQITLFDAYLREANNCSVKLAQFLLTRPYLVTREHYLNLQTTINSLLENKIIPVVNENDALVAHTDWSFGDNDALAATLAISFNAQRLIIVSHIDGLCDTDPTKDKNAKLISTVNDVNTQLLKYCSPTASMGSRGGMLSKLKAARIATAVGIEVRIISGLVSGNLLQALNNQGVGTLFLARKSESTISNRDRWLLAAKNSAGSIEIDDGAVQAIKNGKSLLAVGAKKINGQFEKKEIVEIVDFKKIGVAFGMVDFSSDEILDILASGNLRDVQLMHTDNLIKIS